MKTVQEYINEAAEVKRPKYCQTREAFFKKYSISEDNIIESFDLDNSFESSSFKSDLLKGPYLHEATKMYYVKYWDPTRWSSQPEYGLYFETDELPLTKKPIRFNEFLNLISKNEIKVNDNDVLKDLYREYKYIFNDFDSLKYFRRCVGEYIGEPITSKDELMSMVYGYVSHRGSYTYNDGKEWSIQSELRSLMNDSDAQEDLYNEMKRDLYNKEGVWDNYRWKNVKESDFKKQQDVMSMISDAAEELYKKRQSVKRFW
jgi:hypothetical protein